MINVLFIYGDILRCGGIESYMMNYYRHIDNERVHIDFAVQGYDKGLYDDEIIAGGSYIYHMEKPGKHPVEYRKQMKQLLLTGRYQIIHAHCDAMNSRIMRLAKSCGIPVRIAHSHNTQHILNSKAKYLFYEYCRHQVIRYATECWACSDAAGRWLFGEKGYKIVPNAIEMDRFSFEKGKREKFREKYKIQKDDIVLGHVGRFDYQKNHDFLIDVFQKLVETGRRKYRLLMVGEGAFQERIRRKVIYIGLQEKVIFTGGITNPEDYYNLMDLFLLPSFFEGYPLVITEAEANGLKCIVSDCISDEIDKIGMIRSVPLDKDMWFRVIEQQDCMRKIATQERLKNSGFDIYTEAEKVQNEYIRLCKDSVKQNEKK